MYTPMPVPARPQRSIPSIFNTKSRKFSPQPSSTWPGDKHCHRSLGKHKLLNCWLRIHPIVAKHGTVVLQMRSQINNKPISRGTVTYGGGNVPTSCGQWIDKAACRGQIRRWLGKERLFMRGGGNLSQGARLTKYVCANVLCAN